MKTAWLYPPLDRGIIMTNNYFKVSRGLLFSDRWLCEKFTRGQAWVDLFGLAQHTKSYFMVRGIRINVERGQLAYSQLTLAKRWRWSRNKVRGYLATLEKDGDIKQQNNEVTTLITIVKYNLWQGNDTTNDTTEGQQKDNRKYTYKNVEKVENEKKERGEGNQSSLKEILEHYNATFGKKSTSTVAWENNAIFWLKHHSLEDIKKAITLWYEHGFAFKIDGDGDLSLLFRQSNKAGRCDYIEEILTRRIKLTI